MGGNIINQKEENKTNLSMSLESAKLGTGAIIINGDVSELYYDDRMRDIIGVSDDMSPSKCYDFVVRNFDLASRKKLFLFLKKMISGENAEFEGLYHNPVKGDIYVRCMGRRSNEDLKDGKICIYGCFQDITELHTEKRHMQEALLFSQLLAHDYVNIYIVNPKDETVEVRKQDGYVVEDVENGSFEKFPYDVTWKKYIDSCVHPSDRYKLYQAGRLDEVLKNLEDKAEYTYNYRTVNNGLQYYQFKFMPLGDGRILAGFRNIDELIKTEKEKARISREHLFNELQEYNKVIDTLGEEYVNIYSININTNTMYVLKQKGYHAVDVLDGSTYRGFEWNKEWQHYVNTIVHEEDRKYLLSAGRVEKVISKLKENYDYSKSYRTVRDGKIVYYQVRFVMFDEATIIACFRDINDLINREFEHRRIVAETKAVKEALNQAEIANKAKTVFLNNMSHDIRTPMNAIIGFTSLAYNNIEDVNKIRNYLDKIRTSSNHLLALINDVLDMSRIESGKVTIQVKDESLSKIIHDIKNIIQSDAKKKHLNLFFDIINVKDEQIICDELRLRQVLINCLNNAIKFTPENGTVGLRVEQKACSIPNHALYEFAIIDTGIGIEREFIEHVFEPFSREENIVVNGIQGTGLGMSITKSIVDMMDGKIKVESEKNFGAKILISVAFEKSVNNVENKETHIFNSLKALAIDVNSESCDNLVSMLNEIGVDTDWAMSEEESFEKLREANKNELPYSLYLLDELTDSFGGIDTARKIREEVGSKPYIILLTSSDIPEIEQCAKEAGVTILCDKPMFMSDLNKTLELIIYGKNNQEAEKVQDIKLDGLKLLLVEDNELNRELACENLQEFGAKVDTAADGLMALEKMKSASQDTYDIILMDIQMPLMNGYEAAAAIRNLPDKNKARIPIIALSANAFEEDRKKSLECGMNEHVAKPIDIDVLVKVIDSIMRS
ncbi:MAG: response regulator [Lachnospiraceae bacterium]|nr:response regulator [Lachnospiraceae bacterium]